MLRNSDSKSFESDFILTVYSFIDLLTCSEKLISAVAIILPFLLKSIIWRVASFGSKL